MRTVRKLLEIAASQIGYHEKKTNASLYENTANSGDQNFTKYARDLHAAGYYQASKQGCAWCDMYVDWCFLQLCGNRADAEAMTCQTGLYGAGCEWSAKYYRQQGRFHTSNPEPGDQIFFRNYAHTGIVEKVENGLVHTIEGNTSNTVARRVYSINSTAIDGYGRPKYEADVQTKKEFDITVKGLSEEVYDKISDILDAAKIAYDVNEREVVVEIKPEPAPVKKSVEEVAREVYLSRWGNGSERRKRLEAAGYNYRAVQDLVNEMCRKKIRR